MVHVMYEEKIPTGRRHPVASLPTMTSDLWNKPYTFWEGAWGLLLLVCIFAINIAVLWVVSRSRELWKPRHLWMACLCITDLFVGGHKALELLLLVWPQHELCVLQRATLGIPYVVNMLLLTLLSLDRFVAVRHPFFYSSSVSNKHVGIGFIIVLVAGTSLAAASVTLGLQDPICRSQSLQLVYLTIVLAICSVLTLLFNSAVLRIAKKQLNAIYAHEPSFRGAGRRKLSVVCSNCGYRNETFVNTLGPITGSQGALNMMTASGATGVTATSILPLTDAVVLGPLDLEQVCEYHNQGGGISGANGAGGCIDHLGDGCDTVAEAHLLDMEATSPLVKTVSLPAISDMVMNVPISMVVQPDPAIPPAVLIGSIPTDVIGGGGGRVTSMSQLNDAASSTMIHHNEFKLAGAGGGLQTFQTLPRSRSLVSCQTHKIMSGSSAAAAAGPRLQLFRNLHLARAHMFHVGRLFPSIRFARTVLLIMIPMWVFILPIVIIIPLHRGCEDGNESDLNCELVGTLWRYLIIHMRSILPLQAILDTLIYAFGSKEFRSALVKLVKKYRTTK
ncbi:uncharacterized protein LOC118433349 isoform X2 [Folsomia candida]|uniref:P2Y purinoceptor 4 n=1 Tax=Folsomia candida TaxID=158441 RepID=A0A226CXS6_FOLCA|nr:uncharacterized protein LOC118433349 isoform X2 [Folsomia candida]OXA38135.1 P2Y purinoceptor 4 [Folsomia candida]